VLYGGFDLVPDLLYGGGDPDEFQIFDPIVELSWTDFNPFTGDFFIII